ncbi:MAG: class I SAM-dependent methyltransferase [Anaerolineae bacterium]|nr:class I SAM-dependent methyltransferase [Anaerolineae bacterium]
MTPESVAFDRAVEYYDETRGFPPGEEQRVAALIQQVGGLTATSRVLEIGIGTGRIALPVAPHIQAYFGVDISRPMMLKLQSKLNGEPIYITQGDATRLPFPDDTFDAAVAVHVFHLIPGWQDVLRELQRVLKPDGVLIHALTRAETDFQELWQAWESVVSSESKRDVGIQWRNGTTFLEDSGWMPHGEWQELAYSQSITPRLYIERVRQRIWSRCWRATDTELEAGVQAMEKLMQVRYPNADAPIAWQSVFTARAYRKPSKRV